MYERKLEPKHNFLYLFSAHISKCNTIKLHRKVGLLPEIIQMSMAGDLKK
jgi:hypothetical protein